MKFGLKTPTNATTSSNNNNLLIGVVLVLVLLCIYGCYRYYYSSGSLKELDVVMFMSPTCPWSKKMLGVLGSQVNDITVVDITTKEGTEFARNFGADKQPVPSFISRVNKTGTVGYRDNVSALVETLQVKGEAFGAGGGDSGSGAGDDFVNKVKKLQIVFFSREGCPWCVKAKASCAEAGVTDVIQMVDITTPEGQKMAEQLLPPNSSGVPAFVSMATKKHLVGFKPIMEVVEALSV